ncbi:DUF480 domain-containing protein [Nocardioides panaciterrulae]|uniref:Methyltransferase domain-containing protein n=1 Tax=Nocardioides panaciterrulae TaxID=661492 RepID=A0A7Y9JAS8_9ACTN|nr:DUF480 domain-containing protein [Nocardioides panaciterrulae]NYD40539.1 hypothetical protein [Nocardioides panaciterrulae]
MAVEPLSGAGSELPVLDAEEQRVLGCLLEKQVTVPASYPLTLSALRTACNQSSSRDPVVDYDERTVEATAKRLKDRGLLRIVWSDTGRRTLKYHQVLAEALGLAEDERALLTVLLLRGAQTPGELRTRSERLHAFAERRDVEELLGRMAERGLARELARQPGQHDARWVHCLGEAATAPVPAAPIASPGAPGSAGAVNAVDRESVLADGAAARDERVRTSYDAIATAYADALVDELLDGQPFETWLLDRVTGHADGRPVVEVGCGPGHVTAYLAEAGADATGLDLSPGMVAEARRRFPDGAYEVGDLRRLMRPTSAPGWAAVLGWYSLIHLAGSELPVAVAALARPLAPGGWLVLALHAGAGVRHNGCWFDLPVDLDVVLHEPGDVTAAVRAAGLVDIEWYRRGPLTHRGETTERLYVVGRAPA